MSNGQLEVAVNLTNDKVQFAGISKTNPDRPITFDYLPPLGDGQGFRGLELLLMSFSGCVSTTVVHLLRKRGRNVSGFRANAEGVRQELPSVPLKIYLEIILESEDTSVSELEDVVRQAESLSPVWLALKNNIDVVKEYKVVTP